LEEGREDRPFFMVQVGDQVFPKAMEVGLDFLQSWKRFGDEASLQALQKVPESFDFAASVGMVLVDQVVHEFL